MGKVRIFIKFLLLVYIMSMLIGCASEPGENLNTTGATLGEDPFFYDIQLPSSPVILDCRNDDSDPLNQLTLSNFTYNIDMNRVVTIKFYGTRAGVWDSQFSASFQWRVLDCNNNEIMSGTYESEMIPAGAGVWGTISFSLATSGTYWFEIVDNDSNGDKSPEETKPEESKSLGVHIVILSEQIDAQRILDTWDRGDRSEQSMVNLMRMHSGYDLYFVTPGELLPELDTWCFAEGRAVGDTAIIQGSYGYAVCYISTLPQ